MEKNSECAPPSLLTTTHYCSVSFAGAMAVLVTVQLLASLAVANLVSRKDEPPFKLVEPLHGVLGKVLCLSNLPLLGQVSYCLSRAKRRLKREVQWRIQLSFHSLHPVSKVGKRRVETFSHFKLTSSFSKNLQVENNFILPLREKL